METVNQRAHRRFQVAIRASAINRANQESFPCLIRDGSISGCRIICDHLNELPDEICLEVPSIEQPIEGRIVWREDKSAGIAFNWKANIGIERRGAARHTVDIPAIVLDVNFKPIAKCRVCDTSRTGCRIRIDEDTDLPEKLRFEIEGVTGAMMANIVWRKDNLAGVEFIWDSDVYVLEDEEP